MDECWGEDLLLEPGGAGGAMVVVLPELDASVVLLLEPAVATVLN